MEEASPSIQNGEKNLKRCAASAARVARVGVVMDEFPGGPADYQAWAFCEIYLWNYVHLDVYLKLV